MPSSQKPRKSLYAQFFEHWFRELPPLSTHPRDQLYPNPLEGMDRIQFSKLNSHWQQRSDVFGQAPGELFKHALLGHRACYRSAFKCQIVVKACNDLFRGQRELLQSLMQIKQVAARASLQQRAQLRAEQFLGLERRDLSLASVPVVFQCKGISLDAEQVRVLASVDLDLEL